MKGTGSDWSSSQGEDGRGFPGVCGQGLHTYNQSYTPPPAPGRRSTPLFPWSFWVTTPRVFLFPYLQPLPHAQPGQAQAEQIPHPAAYRKEFSIIPGSYLHPNWSGSGLKIQARPHPNPKVNNGFAHAILLSTQECPSSLALNLLTL